MKRIKHLMNIALAALFCLSCTKKAVDKNTLVVALGQAPSTLDPRFATDAAGMRIGNLIFSSIVRLGPDLKIIGEIAESWTYNEKEKTYEFALRPGITFADGSPLTAEDISFSFDQYRAAQSPFANAYKMIESVEARYDEQAKSLRIKLKEFSATFLTDLTPLKILPKTKVSAMGQDFQKSLVGTGPFEFVKQDTAEIVLKARASHVYAKPNIQNVVFKIIRDENTRYLKMLKGEVDLAQSELPLNKVSEFEKNEKFKVFKYPGLSMTYLLVNMQDPLLSKLLVRQGISQSLNRDEIIKFKLDGLGTEATSILGPTSPFFNSDLKNLPMDVDKAKLIFAKEKANEKEIILKTSNSQVAVENGKVLVNQLEKAGLKMKHQSFEWGTFYGDIQKGNFQLATMKWVGSTDPDIYRTGLHSKEVPPGRNRGHYVNPALDKLLEDGLRISNEDKRRAHYLGVQKIVLEDLPIIPLWYDTEVAVINQRVLNYEPSKNGDFSSLTKVQKSE